MRISLPKITIILNVLLSAGVCAAQAKTQTAILAGGCFWGMEEILRQQPGILSTQVGYSGGTTKNPTYEEVSSGKTGHAESVEIRFDPKKITYERLLKLFFKMHDPTTLNQQHNDVGTQYRSAIFYLNDEQKKTAEEVKALAERAWQKPVVTEITKAGKFYAAEAEHQKYLVKHPTGYTCHFIRKFKSKELDP